MSEIRVGLFFKVYKLLFKMNSSVEKMTGIFLLSGLLHTIGWANQ